MWTDIRKLQLQLWLFSLLPPDLKFDSIDRLIDWSLMRLQQKGSYGVWLNKRQVRACDASARNSICSWKRHVVMWSVRMWAQGCVTNVSSAFPTCSQLLNTHSLVKLSFETWQFGVEEKVLATFSTDNDLWLAVWFATWIICTPTPTTQIVYGCILNHWSRNAAS